MKRLVAVAGKPAELVELSPAEEAARLAEEAAWEALPEDEKRRRMFGRDRTGELEAENAALRRALVKAGVLTEAEIKAEKEAARLSRQELPAWPSLIRLPIPTSNGC
jgi:hypothetical protein